MSEIDGQVWHPHDRRRDGRWWRWPGTALILLIEAILLIVAIGGTALAWRAAQGPVDLSLLLPKIGRVIAVAAPRLDVSIGHLAVAWKGFTRGADQPVRVTGAAISVDDPAAGRSLSVDRLSLDLSAAWAVRGVVAPRTVTLDGPTVTLQMGSAAPPAEGAPFSGHRRPMTAHDIIAVLERPPETDRHLVKERPAALSELTRLTITGGQVLLQPSDDATSPKMLRVGDIAGVITRGAAGGLTGQVSALLSAVGTGAGAPTTPPASAQSATVAGTVTISTAGIVHVLARAKLDDPAALLAAIAPPQGTPILSLPLQATADVTTAADLTLTTLKASLTGGKGTVLVDGAAIPVGGLALGVTGDQDHLAVDPGSHVAFGAVSAQAGRRRSPSGAAVSARTAA